MTSTTLPPAKSMALKFGHVHTEAVHVYWTESEHSVTVPVPDIGVLEEYGVTPDELRADGYAVPKDEADALAYAIEHFRESENYDDWTGGFSPVMNGFWPCDPVGSPEQAAALMHSVGTACSLVRVEIADEWVTGIALTGGSMDLSDHIAAAYVCCGRVPPIELIRSALRTGNPLVAEHLVEAARVATKHVRSDLDYIDELAAKVSARSIAEAAADGPRP
jgi:hypothetical protein